MSVELLGKVRFGPVELSGHRFRACPCVPAPLLGFYQRFTCRGRVRTFPTSEDQVRNGARRLPARLPVAVGSAGITTGLTVQGRGIGGAGPIFN